MQVPVDEIPLQYYIGFDLTKFLYNRNQISKIQVTGDFFTLFQVDIDKLEDIIFWFHVHLRVQREDILKWEYYVFEGQLERLAEMIKKKNDANNNSNSGYDNSKIDPNKYLRSMNSNMPKMPSMPKI